MLPRMLSATFVFSLLLGPLAGSLAIAEETSDSENKAGAGVESRAGSNADSEADTYLKPDGSWIRLSGRAVEAGPDNFMLDYEGGKVFVEIANPDWHFDNTEILDGDHVTVFGKVDDETYEATSIKAHSVYVEDLETYLFGDPTEGEGPDPNLDMEPNTPARVGDVSITGTIESVDGRTFMLEFGKETMKVDTSGLDYDPLDEQGFQQLEQGDVVTVVGNITDGSLEDRKLSADGVITMSGQASPPFPARPDDE